MDIVFKICTKCLLSQPLSDFYKRSGKCKKCCIDQAKQTRLANPEATKEYLKQWRKKHPLYQPPSSINLEKQEVYKRTAQAKRPLDYHRWKHILANYGLTKDQWISLFNSQGNMCACCLRTEPLAQNWHTDHNHITGEVRGIVCQPCNEMIKGAQDSKLRLQFGIHYLEKTDG